MSASAGSPGALATQAMPPIPLGRRLYGLGSIYGKTIRDSRLSFTIAAGLLGGMALVMGLAVSNIFPTPAARLQSIQEQLQAQLMTAAEGRRALGNADLRADTRRACRLLLQHLMVLKDLLLLYLHCHLYTLQGFRRMDHHKDH